MLQNQALTPQERDILADHQSRSIPINFKRIFTRAVRFWYLIVLSIVAAFTVAYLINRYTTRIYQVTASIIVREGDENAGAKFLYNNPLVNPYRNFFNELYIMRSYPLLQEVIEQLNFEVAWYREGEVKTSEVYAGDFPFEFRICKGRPYGRSIGFQITGQETFLVYELDNNGEQIGKYGELLFNDTLSIQGSKFIILKRGKIDEDLINKYFVVRFVDPFSLSKSYANRLKATWAEQGASVVNLDISGPLPQKEIDFLTKFIERYQQYDIDKKNQVASKSIEFLDAQLASIGDSLNYFDNQIENFKQSNYNSNFEGRGQQLVNTIEDLKAQRAQLILYNNYYDYLEKYLKESQEFDQIVPPSAVGISDNILTGLIAQLTDLQFSIRMLGDQQTEENPMVAERRQRIQQLKRDIYEGIRSIRATQKINDEFIAGQIAKLEQELSRLPESERALVDIRRSYTVRENLYLFLMQKRAEAGISRASTTSDIIVVNPPTQKGGAITPQPLQNYIIALAGGILLPFLIFLGAELANNRVQSKEDIEQLTSIPVVGGIGHNTLVKNNLVVLNKPKSAMAESFRALRSNLNYFTEGKDKKIFLITSSVSGEGKTFTTINLATVMAFAGKKVLIIGADMRRPKIYTDFDLSNEIGLSTYLSSMSELDEVIQQTKIENLFLMSGGPVPPNPGELLLSPKTGAMVRLLLDQFDYVIIDSPPLGLVSDAFSLMSFVDHTIFMVRQNYTPRHFLKNIQELFERQKIKNISILFNDIRKTGPGYGYGYTYGYGYRYYGYGYGYGYGTNKKNVSNLSGGYYSEDDF